MSSFRMRNDIGPGPGSDPGMSPGSGQGPIFGPVANYVGKDYYTSFDDYYDDYDAYYDDYRQVIIHNNHNVSVT